MNALRRKTGRLVVLGLMLACVSPISGQEALHLDAAGNLGIGTSTPAARLHIYREGSSEIRIEQSGTATADATLRFVNFSSAGPNGNAWVFNHRGANGNLLLNYTGNAGNEFSVTPTGNVVILGNLVTGGGGTCDPGPCDGIFSPDYEVESIEEHAAYMWTNRHLWGVGPTPEGEPINLTLKTTGMLHELEKAHIYIEQLHSDLKKLQAENERLRAELDERLSRLEAQIANESRE